MGFFDRFSRGARRRAEARQRAIGRIRDAVDRGDADEALRASRAAAREPFADTDVYRAVADALVRFGDREAGELFARAADAPEDVEAAFALGSFLLTREEPELAAAVLGRASDLAPFDAVLRCELAVALARSGRPDAVVRTLVLHPDLAGDPGALFELAWASLLILDFSSAARARETLLDLDPPRELLAKLDAALTRADALAPALPPSARDYYFLEHGALLLDAEGEDSGRYESVVLDSTRLARLGALLVGALRELDLEIARVEPVDPRLVSFARALEHDLSRTSSSGRALVVAVDAPALAAASSRAVTFALALDPTKTAPLSPDFVGVMTPRAEIAFDPAVAVSLPELHAPELRSYIDARRAHLPPHGERVATAFVPDAPRTS